MEAGIWEIERADLEGWMLLAPTTFWEASFQEIEDKTGGCGPGAIGDWFVPDTMYGESVFLACQIHDWMYGEGKTLEDKKIADRVFLWNITVLIQEEPETMEREKEILDPFRLRRGMTYYEAVSLAGNAAFEKGVTPNGSDISAYRND